MARSTRSNPSPTANRQKLLVALLLLAMLCIVQLAYMLVSSMAEVGAAERTEEILRHERETVDYEQITAIGPGTVLGENWRIALSILRRSRTRYVIIDAKNGLGNRLRALASAMAVAEYLGRPVLLIWQRDLHLNCSISSMFSQPLPFALLEAEIPREELTSTKFQLFNYMRPEPGAVKDEPVDVDPDRHLVFRSAFVMNHPLGGWASGGPQRQLRRLRPSDEVRAARSRAHTIFSFGVHSQLPSVLLC